MEMINGQQCRDARKLLRWNIKDLVHKSGVNYQRIYRFEGALEVLYPDEQRRLIKTFDKAQILFTEGGGVKQTNTSGKSASMSATIHQIHEESAEAVLARLLQGSATD